MIQVEAPKQFVKSWIISAWLLPVPLLGYVSRRFRLSHYSDVHFFRDHFSSQVGSVYQHVDHDTSLELNLNRTSGEDDRTSRLFGCDANLDPAPQW